MFSPGKILGLSLVVFIIGLVLSTAYLYKRNLVLSNERDKATRNEMAYRKDIQSYRDANGMLVSKVYLVEDKLSNLERSSESNYARYRDIIKAQNLKLSQVTGITHVETGIDTTFSKPTTIFKRVIPDTCFTLGDSLLGSRICLDSSRISANIYCYNKQDLIYSKNRETVNPPYKFFIWRMFQRKHDVFSVRIVNSNKAIKTNEAEWKLF